MNRAMYQIMLAPNFFDEVKGKRLLLDTNVFIDASVHVPEFLSFFTTCRKNNVSLVTSKSVEIEFTRGTVNDLLFHKKKEIIKDIVNEFIPTSSQILEDLIPYLVKQYREHGKAVSLTDYILGGLLMQYEDVLLLTKNPKDFPSSVFKLETYFLIHLDRSLQCYGVYSFKRKYNTHSLNLKNHKRSMSCEKLVPTSQQLVE